jgi:dTMP kinase
MGIKQLDRGMLIAVEGIDGSGKSTLVNNLATAVRAEHLPVVVTKEPGGTPLGKQLRTILQEQQTPLDPKAEYLLFAADRAQHFKDLIMPALQHNNIVISDRMADSSLVYQGFGRGLNKEMIMAVNQWAMHGIKPDLTIYVAITPDIAWQRLQKRGATLTAFEQEKKSFVQKLVVGFETIYNNRSDVITLDGSQDTETLTKHAYEKVVQWIAQHQQQKNNEKMMYL